MNFTCATSDSELPFLDIKVLLRNGNLSTSLYTKPTDTHSYLRYDSAHAPHVCNSIPYSQFLRVHRICTDFTDSVKQCVHLGRYFLHQGYPLSLILKSLTDALKQDRIVLLQKETQNSDPIVKDTHKFYYINTFNHTNPNFRSVIEKYWPLLGRSSATRHLLDTQIVYGFRRCNNLRDLLVRARLPPISAPTKRIKRVIHENCKYCSRLDRSGKLLVNNQTFHTMQNVNCESSNLIYALRCNLCCIIYVGQTMNTVKERFSNHLSTIKNGYDTTVARHFNLAHKIHSDPPFKIFILEFIKLPPKSHRASILRDTREQAWIARLNTLVPSGLNLADG